MRYVLAAGLLCALGAPAAFAVPAADTIPAVTAKGDLVIEAASRQTKYRRHHRHRNRPEGRPLTRNGPH